MVRSESLESNSLPAAIVSPLSLGTTASEFSTAKMETSSLKLKTRSLHGLPSLPLSGLLMASSSPCPQVGKSSVSTRPLDLNLPNGKFTMIVISCLFLSLQTTNLLLPLLVLLSRFGTCQLILNLAALERRGSDTHRCFVSRWHSSRNWRIQQENYHLESKRYPARVLSSHPCKCHIS